MLVGFYQDVRHGLRNLFLRPSVTIAVAVVAMAVGIGAAVAIFSVVDAVLLRPLPYPEPERVVAVWNQFTRLDLPEMSLSEPEVLDYRTRCTSLKDVAAISIQPASLTGSGEPERLRIAAVSPSLFGILGVRPSRGRVFAAGEDRPGSPRLALLSDAFWRRRQGADPQVVGRDLLMNGDRYTIVGVMPPAFHYPEKVDLWVPLLPSTDPSMRDRANHYLRALGRLKPGVSLRSAQAEIHAVALQMQRETPAKYPADSGWGAILVPFQEDLTGDIRPALLMVLAAVGLVLLMACANVANLQLERALARSREIAVRTALGEPRGRLIRRFIAESLVVTFIGGGAGVLLAALAVRALAGIDPATIPRAYDIAIDGRVLLFAVVLALASGLAIGLVPAVQTSKQSLTGALKEGGEKSAGGRGERRVRRLLAIVETALALVLVIGAGLLARTFANLQHVDPGIDTNNTLSLRIALPAKKYATPPQQGDFFQRLVDGVAALPGVRHAGVVDCLALSGCDSTGSYYPQDHLPVGNAAAPEADLRIVTWDYFAAVGMRSPLKGRLLTAQDRAGAPQVVIIDEELARRTWPGENAVGKHLDFMPNPQRTVVGVVRHVKNSSNESQPREQIYVPFAQYPYPTTEAFLVIRTASNPAALTGPVRDVVRKLDANLPIFDVQTLSERRAKAMAPQQLSMTLLLSLGTLALFLAAVGMYSVIAYSASQRSREIGVRMALGAQRRDILSLVVGEGLIMGVLGVAAGLAMAYWATRLLGSLLFGIRATDLVTYLATSLLLIATAVVASYLPARKATRSSPIAALGRN